jgi:hypothetical protein
MNSQIKESTGTDTTNQSKRMSHQWRVSPRTMSRELTGGGGVGARALEKAGAKPVGGDEAAENGTGKFDSNLSMVSIANAYPTKYSKESKMI